MEHRQVNNDSKDIQRLGVLNTFSFGVNNSKAADITPGDLCERQTHGDSNKTSSMAPAFGTTTLCGAFGVISNDEKAVSSSHGSYRPPHIHPFHHHKIQRQLNEEKALETPMLAPSRRLTDNEREFIFQCDPSLRQKAIADLLGVDRSTISRVLRQKEEGLFEDDGSRSPWKGLKRKSPNIDRALLNWVRKCKKQGSPLSDAIIRQRAELFLQVVGDSESNLETYSSNWLEKFKEKNYHMGPRSRKGTISQDFEGTLDLLSNVTTDTAPTISSARPTSPTSLSSSFFTPKSTVASDVRSTPAIKACDNCRKRKTKCVEGDKACEKCHLRKLKCTYDATPQKRGPRGSRAKDLSKLRKTQRNVQLAPKLPTDLDLIGHSVHLPCARTQDLVTPDLVRSCMNYFFSHVYPLKPVLRRQRAQEAVDNMSCSIEAYCMIAALCAYVMIQAHHKPPASMLPRPQMADMPAFDIGRILLEESVRVRQGYDYRDIPSYMSVLTSWLYSGCYFGLARENPAWNYFSEATTQARLLGMHLDETYNGNSLDVSHMRMLYWVLFIAERTYALRDGRPISLHATIHPPSLDEDPSDRPIAIGLRIMIDMFTIFDDTFINLWNGVQNTHDRASLIEKVQHELFNAVPKQLVCTNGQKIQIHTVKLWLNLKLWQKRQQEGLLGESKAVRKGPFSPLHPIEIASGALTMWKLFVQQDRIILGQGMIEKLCDIADCVVNTLQKWPAIPEFVCVNWLLKFWNFMRRLIPTDNERQNTLEEISKVVAQYPSNRLRNRACGIQNDDEHSLTPYCNQLEIPREYHQDIEQIKIERP